MDEVNIPANSSVVINNAHIIFRDPAMLKVIRAERFSLYGSSLSSAAPSEPTVTHTFMAGAIVMANGGVFQNLLMTKAEVVGRPAFLFGRNVMPSTEIENEGDTTPGREMYLAVQFAYVGDYKERRMAGPAAQQLIEAFIGSNPASIDLNHAKRALNYLHAGAHFQALQAIRRIMVREDDGRLRRPGPDKLSL
jgi:flagellar biosynthesis regulator FlbT